MMNKYNMTGSRRATKALIDRGNLRHNLKEIRGALKDGVFMCVAVKANGYGCGAVTASRAAIEEGASFLAVATVEEGRELREGGITAPILLMSMCAPDEVFDAVRLHLTPFVFDKEYISDFAKAAEYASYVQKEKSGGASHLCLSQEEVPYQVHLAVDTGMGRIGCRAYEAAELANLINGTGSLKLAGMCTHFAAADSIAPSDREYTDRQFALFIEAIDNVRQAGIDPGIRHCAESVALFDRPEMQLDMVRAGIVTYGYYPGDMTREYFENKGTPVDLLPVMTLETEVCAVRHFRAGESVSYGRTWQAKKDTDIAVLPIGYADGLLRRYSPGLEVAINGKGYPAVGRICMDQCMVDVGSNSGIVRGDKAIIFGDKAHGALHDASGIAKMAGTISYEVMTSITARVPRIEV